MSRLIDISTKIFDRPSLIKKVIEWKKEGFSVVFTNGCFDILHKGHLEILEKSASFGDKLIVGMNSDASVKRLKGLSRPINKEDFRILMMASIQWVDAVCIFEEDTPELLIESILPDVLVKGGDYTLDQIIGSKQVLDNHGKVMIIPIVEGFSTTTTIKSIQSS